MLGNILVQSKQLLLFLQLIHWKGTILVKKMVSILLLLGRMVAGFPCRFVEGIILTGASGSFVSFTRNCVAVALGQPLVEPCGQPFDTSALLFLLHSVLFWLSFELPKYAALLCRFPGTVSFTGPDKDWGFARAHGSILTVVLCVSLADSCFWQGFFFSEILLEKGEEWSLGSKAFNSQNKPCQVV